MRPGAGDQVNWRRKELGWIVQHPLWAEGSGAPALTELPFWRGAGNEQRPFRRRHTDNRSREGDGVAGGLLWARWSGKASLRRWLRGLTAQGTGHVREAKGRTACASTRAGEGVGGGGCHQGGEQHVRGQERGSPQSSTEQGPGRTDLPPRVRWVLC